MNGNTISKVGFAVVVTGSFIVCLPMDGTFLCRLARRLGPGSAVGEKGKKRGEIRKISTSRKKISLSEFLFSHTGVFLLFPQCGAWSQAKLRVVVNEYVCVSLHTDRLVYFK